MLTPGAEDVLADDYEAELAFEGNAGADSEGVAAPRAQFIITGSWLTMKEVGRLLGTLAHVVPATGAGEDFRVFGVNSNFKSLS